MYFFVCFLYHGLTIFVLQWDPVHPEVLYLVESTTFYFFWTHFCERCGLTSAVNNKSGTCLLSSCWCWVWLSHSPFPKQISHFLFYLTASCISFLFLPGLWSLATSLISSSLTEQIVCLVTCSHLTYPYFTSYLSITGLFHNSVSPTLTSLSAMAT